MKRWQKILSSILIFLFLLVAIGPFLVPVPELEGLVSEDAFLDADSKFIEINNVNIHYKEAGAGEMAFVLLHGFGGSTYSWREVMDDFSEQGHVIAYDRPAFGLTERPLEWEGESPYGPQAQVDIVIGLMDELGVETVVHTGYLNADLDVLAV